VTTIYKSYEKVVTQLFLIWL